MTLLIRPEIPDDFPAVFTLVDRAFGGSKHGEAPLTASLRFSPAFVPELSLVAVSDGEIVGQILLTQGSVTGDSKKKLLALGPLSVLPERQKQGIGGDLMRRALEIAEKMGFDGVFLLGHLTYYPKFGFRPASEWGLTNNLNVSGDAWMARPLRPGGLDGLTGEMASFDAALMERKMRRRVTDEELDALGAEPTSGEVWWCDGGALGFSDGGKTRPVLILALTEDTATVAPLTTRRPASSGISVRHSGGVSWMTETRTTISRLALLSSLGAWTGFAQWKGSPK